MATNASEPLGDEAWYDAVSLLVATDELVPLMCLAVSPPTKAVALDPSISTVLGSQYHMWQCQGDGNCFYRAVSKALFDNDGEGHELLRELIKDWAIVNQLLVVEPSFTSEQLATKSVEQRAHQIGRLGEYAD